MTVTEHAQVPDFNPNIHRHSEDDGFLRKVGKWIGEHKILSSAGIGALAGSLATTAFIGMGSSKEAPRSLHDVRNNPGIAGPIVPGPGNTQPISPLDLNRDGEVSQAESDTYYDQVPPEQFAKLDDRVRVNDVAAKLHKYMPDAYDNMANHFSDKEKRLVKMPDLDEDPMKWSDQELLNYYSTALFLVTTQGATQFNVDEGRRALSVVVSPKDTKNFTSVWNAIGQVHGAKNTYEAQPSPWSGMKLKDGMILGEDAITGEGGRIVRADFIDDIDSDGRDEEARYSQDMVFVIRSDDSGRRIPILAGIYDVGELFIPDSNIQVPR